MGTGMIMSGLAGHTSRKEDLRGCGQTESDQKGDQNKTSDLLQLTAH